MAYAASAGLGWGCGRFRRDGLGGRLWRQSASRAFLGLLLLVHAEGIVDMAVPEVGAQSVGVDGAWESLLGDVAALVEHGWSARKVWRALLNMMQMMG